MNTNKTEQIWEDIVHNFRQVCVLRREGRVVESNRILEKELPRKISLWSQVTPDPESAKRAALQGMFREQEKKVEEAWAIQSLLAQKITEELIPPLCFHITEEVKEAILQQMSAFSGRLNASLQNPRTATSVPRERLWPAKDNPFAGLETVTALSPRTQEALPVAVKEIVAEMLKRQPKGIGLDSPKKAT
jgi:hypothetical protein